MKKKFTILLMFVCAITLFTNCDDEEEEPVGNTKMTSFVMTVSPSEWVLSTADNLMVEKPAPAITLSAVNYGAVLVYAKSSSTNTYQALPYYWAGTTILNRYWYSVNEIQIELILDGEIPPTPTSTKTYKIVILETVAKELGNTHVDYTNYEDVKSFYNLKE